MTIESKPELDQLIARFCSWRSSESLKQERDEASKEQLRHIEAEIAGLKEEANALRARWKARKKRLKKFGRSRRWTTCVCRSSAPNAT